MREGARIVTLFGLPGSGKTTLAADAVRRYGRTCQVFSESMFAVCWFLVDRCGLPERLSYRLSRALFLGGPVRRKLFNAVFHKARAAAIYLERESVEASSHWADRLLRAAVGQRRARMRDKLTLARIIERNVMIETIQQEKAIGGIVVSDEAPLNRIWQMAEMGCDDDEIAQALSYLPPYTAVIAVSCPDDVRRARIGGQKQYRGQFFHQDLTSYWESVAALLEQRTRQARIECLHLTNEGTWTEREHSVRRLLAAV